MDTTIANTIIQQLGGRQFAMMYNVKTFYAIDNGVKFKIGRNKSKANMIKITLNGSDLYDVEFINIPRQATAAQFIKYGIKKVMEMERPKVLHTNNDIFCDMLCKCLEDYTGLYTRLI